MNTLITAIIQNAINLHDALNRRDEALNTEAGLRHSEDAGILDQVHLLSLAGTQQARNFQQASDRRRLEALQETQTRSQQDDGLQVQIDTLADASMRQMMNNVEARRRIIEDISKIKQTLNDIYNSLVDIGAMTYRGAKVATKREVRVMCCRAVLMAQSVSQKYLKTCRATLLPTKKSQRCLMTFFPTEANAGWQTALVIYIPNHRR